MRRPTILTTLLLLAILIGSAHAHNPLYEQPVTGPRITGIAYAHVSLSIKFGDGNAPSYELAGSIFPRVELPTQCFFGQRCASGMATPFGYWYDPHHFATNDAYHKEEIDHIRQWEALGPAFIVAYFATMGEPFEPYPVRDFVAIASTTPHHEWYRPENMWEPPADMQRAFPQFRIAWGGQQEKPTTTFMAGYADVGTNIIAAIQGNPTPQLGTETIIATTTPATPYQIAFEQLDGPDYLASNE